MSLSGTALCTDWAEELIWQWQGLTHVHMYTTEEVVGMMDDVNEPICAGRDDDFDDDHDDGQDNDDNSGHDDEQR